MARILGMVALLLGTLALVGCAGPYGYGLGEGLGGGYGGDYGSSGYGASCPQPYGSMPLLLPMPMDPGYAGGYAAAPPYYEPQPYPEAQPYASDYNAAEAYPPGYQSGPPGSPHGWRRDHRSHAQVERRLQHQMDRIQRGLDSGRLTPQEYRRLQAEQGHLRAAMGRMQADGRLGPRESARLNQMQDRNSRDIYRFNHHGATAPADSGATPHRNGYTDGSRFHPGQGSMARPGNHPAGQPGNGPMAGRGRGPGFQPVNGPIARQLPAPGPGFQPHTRMMLGRPPMANGARFQPQPQIMRPAPGPRSQPHGGAGFRRIANP